MVDHPEVTIQLAPKTALRLLQYMDVAKLETPEQAIVLLLGLEELQSNGHIVSGHKCETCQTPLLTYYTKTSHLKLYRCVNCKTSYSPLWFGETDA